MDYFACFTFSKHGAFGGCGIKVPHFLWGIHFLKPVH